jgi:hypothetical protein
MGAHGGAGVRWAWSAMGLQHGYGIARRIEQTSEDLLSINHGTLYPVLLKLEQEGAIASEWVYRRIIAAPSFTASRGPARNSSPRK